MPTGDFISSACWAGHHEGAPAPHGCSGSGIFEGAPGRCRCDCHHGAAAAEARERAAEVFGADGQAYRLCRNMPPTPTIGRCPTGRHRLETGYGPFATGRMWCPATDEDRAAPGWLTLPILSCAPHVEGIAPRIPCIAPALPRLPRGPWVPVARLRGPLMEALILGPMNGAEWDHIASVADRVADLVAVVVGNAP